MKKILMACALAAMAGCDFSTPLVTSPDRENDPALAGLWRIVGSGKEKADLLVLPLNRREYLVSYPAGTEQALFARATLWQSGEARLLQLDWFGTALGTVPDNTVTFQFARFTVEGDQLKAELVEPTEALKALSAPADLSRALVEQWKTPGLFREPMVFTRVRPNTPAADEPKAPNDKPIPGKTPQSVPEV